MDLGADGASEVAGLVRAAVAGDRAGWDGLVRRFAPLVLSVARRHRLDGADAQDVAQTVWLRLVEHLGSLREPAALPGWIVVTARNECLRVLTAARRTTPMDSAVLAEKGEVAVDGRVDSDLLQAERHQVLLAAFAGLSERHRELLLLLAADPPVPYSDITARLGIPTGSIGPTRARALKALRDSPAVRTFLGTDDATDRPRGAFSTAVVGGRSGTASTVGVREQGVVAMTSPLPGDRLPGDRLPGDRLPGDGLPGDGLPGEDELLTGLLAELGSALRLDAEAVERAVEAGRAAWTWRTVEEELAALTRDSWRPEDGFALARDDGERRTLVFEGTTGSVEVQVHGDRVVGQLLPPVPGRVELVMLAGPGAVVLADELGCFALDLPARGPWRLRCTRDTDALVTTWVDS